MAMLRNTSFISQQEDFHSDTTEMPLSKKSGWFFIALLIGEASLLGPLKGNKNGLQHNLNSLRDFKMIHGRIPVDVEFTTICEYTFSR